MKIILNDREEDLNGDLLSVSEMIEQKKFSFRMKVIKINGELIPKENYDTVFIREGDDVRMLYLMSGG